MGGQANLFATISGILHLGNLGIVEDGEGHAAIETDAHLKAGPADTLSKALGHPGDTGHTQTHWTPQDTRTDILCAHGHTDTLCPHGHAGTTGPAPPSVRAVTDTPTHGHTDTHPRWTHTDGRK